MSDVDKILSKYSAVRVDAPHNESVDKILSKNKAVLVSQNPQEQEEEFKWPRFVAEQLGKGVLSIGDLFKALGEAMPVRNIAGKYGRYPHQGTPPIAGNPSELIEETQIPTTPMQRIAGHALRGAGAAAVPIPGLGMGASALAKSVGIGGSAGAISGTLGEMGVPEIPAAIAGLGGAIAGPALAKRAASAFFPTTEKEVARYLQETVGKEQLPSVTERLKNVPPSKIEYEPTTGEVAFSPALAQIQRAQHEMKGSFIPEHLGKGAEQIASSLEFARGQKPVPTGEEVQRSLAAELKIRKGIRKKETEPLYKELEGMKGPLNPVNVKKFIKSTTVKGDLAKDLDYVKGLIQPTEKLTMQDRVYAKHYEQMLSKAGAKQKEQLMAEMESPKPIYPSVAELSAARKAINSRLNKYARSGEESRYRLLKEAKSALDRDLEKIPLEKQASTRYKELSGPVSEISNHPTLKNIIKDSQGEINKSTESIIRRIFDKNSAENIDALKRAFHKDNEALENLRQLGIHHFAESIKNAGAEGKASTLSYPKMNKFMKQHGKALNELLTPEQLGLVDEVGKILKGRNALQTLGASAGSPTASRIINELNRRRGFGATKSHISKIGKGSPFVKEYFEEMANKRQENLTDILNKALIDPKIAHRLLTHKFESPSEFHKFIESVGRQSIPSISTTISQKKSKDNR